MKKRLGKVLLGAALLLILGAGRLEAAGASFPEFSSKTLDGSPVNSAVFAGKKLTMINLWATWCPPCVHEMPDLGNLARSMPEGTQLMGILLDADDAGAIQKAQAILAKSNADFLQVCLSNDMNSFMRGVSAIPTTIFVDSGGRIVGDPVVGART